MVPKADLVIVGGGAAGFFAAIRYADLHPTHRVIILEKSARVLDKVRISGGGRCNVTHACFDPAELVRYYPRGERELLSPFHRFMCGDMMGWLSERGVETKIEEDGRVFPVSDQSESIIQCFLNETRRLEVQVHHQVALTDFSHDENHWNIHTTKGHYQGTHLLIAAGSSKQLWQLIESKGIDIVDPVPSLFTFNIKDPLLTGLMGLSVSDVEILVEGTRLRADGPLLITHWGLSGPAVLRLSAWGARALAERAYRFHIRIDFSQGLDVDAWIKERRTVDARKYISKTVFPTLPRRLWERMVGLTGLDQSNWADASKLSLTRLTEFISAYRPEVNGKSTFKDEFVTAGGVDLKQIDFRTMAHKQYRNLYFAGEVLNIDAITGGFNFQAAWTTAWVAAEAMGDARP